jgi:CSLREA domain-containing protein
MRTSVWALVLVASLTSLTGRTSAATFPVTSTTDDVDQTPGDGLCLTGTGECSLRAAVQEGNALAGPDVVSMAAGTYLLALRSGPDPDQGDLDVGEDLTIEGAGPGATIIDALGGSRVLASTSGVALTLRDLTLRNGASSDAGGAINAEGSLSLEDVVVRDSESGSTGGGVFAGSIDALRSRFTGNVASLGGGGVTAIDGTIRDCTFDDNTADGFLGGSDLLTGGGVLLIANSTSTGSISNFSFCSPPPFPSCSFATTLTLANVTGDGVFLNNLNNPNPGGGIVLRNTVVRSCGGGAFTSEGHNLVAQTPTCTFVGDTTGNRIGIDPLLGPLTDNGGPTATRMPLAGSPLVDGGNPAAPGSGGASCEPADQRGVLRPVMARCDIGAVELRCGDGYVDPEEECDDGNPIDGDGCDSNCRPTGCGNDVVTAGETCDDGNTVAGDCCDFDCALDPAGAPCTSDGNACTDDVCDGVGACEHTAHSRPCDDGSPCTSADHCAAGQCLGVGCNICLECDPSIGCVTPAPTCEAAAPAGSRLRLKAGAGDGRDRLRWAWTSAAPAPKTLLGDPLLGPMQLCVYDGAGGVVASSILTGGGPWNESPNTFRYRDFDLELSGAAITYARISGGARARISVSGRGAGLGLADLPLATPVKVRLVGTDQVTCVEATFAGGVRSNTSGRFRARSD